MGEEYDRRKRGRDDLIRAMANQERKEGRWPDMRRIEREAHQRADRLDVKQDWNIKED